MKTIAIQEKEAEIGAYTVGEYVSHDESTQTYKVWLLDQNGHKIFAEGSLIEVLED